MMVDLGPAKLVVKSLVCALYDACLLISCVLDLLLVLAETKACRLLLLSKTNMIGKGA